MVTYISVSTAPASGGYVTAREVKGGGVTGEGGGAKYVIQYLYSFVLVLGKTANS